MVEGIKSAGEADWREREKGRAAALKAKPVKSIEVERAANGGILATHRYDNSGDGPYKEPKQHAFGKEQEKEVLAHLAEHLGIGGKKPAESDNDE